MQKSPQPDSPSRDCPVNLIDSTRLAASLERRIGCSMSNSTQFNEKSFDIRTHPNYPGLLNLFNLPILTDRRRLGGLSSIPEVLNDVQRSVNDGDDERAGGTELRLLRLETWLLCFLFRLRRLL